MALTLGAAATDYIKIDPDNSNMDGLTAYSSIQWVYPTTITNANMLYRKDSSSATATRKQLRYGSAGSNRLNAVCTRATTNADALSSNSVISTGSWQCVAVTYGETNGLKIFTGSLTAVLAEVSYTSNTVGSGATSVEGNVFVIGNQVAASLAFQGRMATFQFFSKELSLAELIRQQFHPNVTAETKLFTIHGYPGTGTQVDWSGNGNNATTQGVSLVDHVPLGPPFGFTVRSPYKVAAATSKLRRNSSLSGLGASGPFFHDPVSGLYKPSPRKTYILMGDNKAA